MKFKKTICTLTIAACALAAYNGYDYVKAETTDTNTHIEETKEISPFDNTIKTIKTTTTTSTEKIKAEDIEPAILTDLKPEIKEVVTTKTTVKEIKTEDGKTQEIHEKTTNTLNLNTDGVENTIKTEVKTTEVTKEAIPADKQEALQEAAKGTLPELDKIELPSIQNKPVNNKPVKIEVSSQRIPAGTVIPIRLESSVNSIVSNIGDQFNATLTADVMIGDKIVLPSGSVVRGTVGNIRKAGMLVKEAKIMLLFDHIVTPAGKQIPFYSYITNNPNVNFEGYFVGGTSYGKSFKKDAHKSKDIIVNTTQFGVEKGLKYWAGIPVVLTAPCCAIGGTLGGGGYIIGKSVYNIFNKGGEVLLEPGTPLNITITKPLDIPVN